MRGLALCILLVAVALSGCVSEEPPEPAEPNERPGVVVDPTLEPSDEDEPLPAPAIAAVPVHWNGTLGTFVYACEYQTTDVCQGQSVKDDDNSLYVPGPAVVRAIDLTLTWTSTTPVNDRLIFDVMVMGSCATCNDTDFDHVEGASPLTIRLDGLDAAMTAEHVVHAFAYNAALFVHSPPAFAHASLEQAISIDGTVTVELPPDWKG